MSAPKTNRIAELRKRQGLSQQALGDKVGAHWVTISKLERGRMGLTQEWMDRLAAALEVDPDEFLPRARSLGAIRIVGTVKGDGTIYLPTEIADGAELLSEVEESFVPSAFITNPNCVWLKITGFALQPFFHQGDYIQIEWLDHEDAVQMVGRPVVSELEDGSYRIGILGHGQRKDTWDLQGLGSPVMRDVTMRNIARISAAMFDPPPYF